MREVFMKSIRIVAAVLVVATWMGFHVANAAALTTWSTNGAGCVPVGKFGVHVAGGAVTAGAGATVTLYCNIAPPALAVHDIEITYKGGAAQAQHVFTTSELIELSKTTGKETLKCGVQSKGSAIIKSESNTCNNGEMDFNHNFYYVRIVLTSGIAIGKLQTIYGTSLTIN